MWVYMCIFLYVCGFAYVADRIISMHLLQSGLVIPSRMDEGLTCRETVGRFDHPYKCSYTAHMGTSSKKDTHQAYFNSVCSSSLKVSKEWEKYSFFFYKVKFSNSLDVFYYCAK